MENNLNNRNDTDVSREKSQVHNFDRSKLLHLYFIDETIKFDEIKKRADYYGIPVLFSYLYLYYDENYCHTGSEVVFLNDVPVDDSRARHIMVQALKVIFPEAINCTDSGAAGVMLGDPLIKHFDDSIPEINVESLIRNMTIYLRDRYGDTHYKRKIVEFARNNGLKLTSKGLIDISVEYNSVNIEELLESTNDRNNSTISNNSKNSPSSFIIIIGTNGEKLPNKIYVLNLENNTGSNSANDYFNNQSTNKNHKDSRSSTIAQISSNCQLFVDFENGNKELNHSELEAIATTLVNVESGVKLFLEILKKNYHYQSYSRKYDYWKNNISVLNQMDSISERCIKFCPYKNSCYHADDIISTSVTKRQKFIKLANTNEQLYSKDIIIDEFKKYLKEALESNEMKLHAINAPVGSGKSTVVLENMAANPDKKYLFVLSTNELKNELFNKAINEFGISNVVKSPSLHEIKDSVPQAIWKRINIYYQSGKHRAVHKYIKAVLAKGEVNSSGSKVLNKYCDDLDDFYKSSSHAFTTHARLYTFGYWTLMKYDAIIIDEDITINCMIPNIIEILLTEFEEIYNQVDSNTELAKKISAALRAAESESFITLKKIDYDNDYDDITTPIDISSFCRAEKFYHKKKTDENSLTDSYKQGDSIIFFKPLKLDPRLKYIMLSATLDQKILNYFFGASRVKYYECKQAKYEGTLNQYTDRTMSRSDILSSPGIMEKITSWTGNSNRITFKRFSKPGEKYFGKVTGIDSLKGLNIDIIGTPHQPEFLYKLIAHTLGHSDHLDKKMRYQEVRYKDKYKFWFMTFDEGFLRNIQFWMIKSELEQAVGRARLLHCDCIVNVFSNFPLDQADFKESGYDK